MVMWNRSVGEFKCSRAWPLSRMPWLLYANFTPNPAALAAGVSENPSIEAAGLEPKVGSGSVLATLSAISSTAGNTSAPLWSSVAAWADALSGAGLSGAGLPGAGLSGAGLSGAGLSGAGLSGAGLPGAALSAGESRVTVLPPGRSGAG